MLSSYSAQLRVIAAIPRRIYTAKAGSGSIAGPKITGVLRFYRDVSVEEVDMKEDGTDLRKLFAVTLDGKTVKTPRQQPVRLPTRAMAYAVAHEWDAQKHDIRPATMPLMTLVSTALDLMFTSSKKEIIDEIMHYFHTDTVCYQVTANHQENLVALQQKKWKPIRKWFGDTFKGDVDVSHGSIDRLAHDHHVVDKLDDFQLTAMRALTRECKSVIIALAVFKRHITSKEAMKTSRLEEEFQINNWGLVEGGHDLDRVNCAVKLSSASFLLYLLENKHSAI
ncbi:hypothetical protein PsorP6_003558 [Peronosclerospora sorghi]|uniref:Uncharacterized protein n=1 Tax=Peronosclerospora sorghi TaxID=230839 RepID=A0ACC0VSW8_9STRA|nr:hypothetical protein PsorP6_003558 [Peronosclerospora sorghi]